MPSQIRGPLSLPRLFRIRLWLIGKGLFRAVMDEKDITVPYLARIAGVSAQIVWKDVRLLKSML